MTRPGALSGPSRTAVPLWQRAWVDAYPSGVPSSLEYPNVPVHGLLDGSAQRFPKRAACTLYRKATSYEQMQDQIRRFATALHKLGAGPGRQVGMLLPNSPEYLVAMHATWSLGATVLQLSPLMVADELKKWIEKTNCHIVVTLDLLAPALADIVGKAP